MKTLSCTEHREMPARTPSDGRITVTSAQHRTGCKLIRTGQTTFAANPFARVLPLRFAQTCPKSRHPIGVTLTRLRPAFGSGEDWNWEDTGNAVDNFDVAPGLRVGRGLEHQDLDLRKRALLLRPAFGSGEDWNYWAPSSVLGLSRLRPAFGSGEDWNTPPPPETRPCNGCARPSGRARIGTPRPSHRLPRAGRGCARPSGRARIGTRYAVEELPFLEVAPGLRVGRGLELLRVAAALRAILVAPGLRVGRGLELELGGEGLHVELRCARPSGRARIGTPTGSCCAER